MPTSADPPAADSALAKAKGAVGDPGCTCVAKPYPHATAYEGNPEGHFVDCPLWGVERLPDLPPIRAFVYWGVVYRPKDTDHDWSDWGDWTDKDVACREVERCRGHLPEMEVLLRRVTKVVEHERVG